jgi:hypothetical protein
MADISYIRELIMMEKGKPTVLTTYLVSKDENKTLASAYLGTNQTGVADASSTLVTLDTESFDVGSCFSANQYTCTVTGYYQVSFGVHGVGVGGDIDVFFGKICDGSGASLIRGNRGAMSVDGYIGSTGSKLLYCVVGSKLQLMVYSNVSAGNTTLEAGLSQTFMTVYLVST